MGKSLKNNFTFDSLGGSQQEVVLRQNVSNDVYGTFCVKTEQSRDQKELIL